MKSFLPFLILLVLVMGSACTPPAGDEGSSQEETTEVTTKTNEPAADELQTVGEEGIYELQIPDFLRPTSDLNEDATLEYENMLKEFYMIVIHEPIDEFHDAVDEADLGGLVSKDLQGYHDFVTGNLIEAVDLIDEGTSGELSVNGHDGREIGISGSVSGVDIYYHFVTFQGETDYYQVLSWTLNDRKSRHVDNMKAIARSFKEI